jgi:hypothetical protein
MKARIAFRHTDGRAGARTCPVFDSQAGVVTSSEGLSGDRSVSV